MKTCKAVFFGNADIIKKVFPQDRVERIASLCELDRKIYSKQDLVANAGEFSDVQVIFSTWSMPALSTEELDSLPNLQAVFYGAGSVKIFAQPFLEKGITVCSAWQANAVPVAEYTLAQILNAMNGAWQTAFNSRKIGRETYKQKECCTGLYNSTIGLISLGAIAKLVIKLLKPFSVNIIAYDPFCTPEQAQELGISLCTLNEVFQKSHVVSLHTPWLKETEGMITGAHIRQMQQNAVFINTSRGAVVNENEMINALKERTDLLAILDVVSPEPPVEGSPIYTMDNIVLTPHIAGAKGRECWRMADYMVDEFERWLKGEELSYSVKLEMLATMA